MLRAWRTGTTCWRRRRWRLTYGLISPHLPTLPSPCCILGAELWHAPIGSQRERETKTETNRHTDRETETGRQIDRGEGRGVLTPFAMTLCTGSLSLLLYVFPTFCLSLHQRGGQQPEPPRPGVQGAGRECQERGEPAPRTGGGEDGGGRRAGQAEVAAGPEDQGAGHADQGLRAGQGEGGCADGGQVRSCCCCCCCC